MNKESKVLESLSLRGSERQCLGDRTRCHKRAQTVDAHAFVPDLSHLVRPVYGSFFFCVCVCVPYLLYLASKGILPHWHYARVYARDDAGRSSAGASERWSLTAATPRQDGSIVPRLLPGHCPGGLGASLYENLPSC